MPRPYVWQVYEQARIRLNDNDVVHGGEVYQNDKLRPAYQQAYREYFQAAREYDIPIATARCFMNLPAHTSYVDPISYGINNMNAPEQVQVRVCPEVTAASFTLGEPVVVTSVGHGLTNGDMVICSGFPATSAVVDLNGAWPVTVVDADTFSLNGTRFVNDAGTVLGGVYTVGRGRFSFPLKMVMDIPDLNQGGLGYLGTGGVGAYAFYRNALYFNPSEHPQQVLMIYRVSGDAPILLHQEIPIDDGIDFLATRTAGLAAQALGDERAAGLLQQSVGSYYDDGTIGGQLRSLIHGQALSRQHITFRQPGFRARTTSPFRWGWW